MFEAWGEPLSREETNAKLQYLAGEVRKRKLESPAILFLESHKPLSAIGGQASMFFAPFLVPILGYQNVRDYGRLLLDRENVERLICLLEATEIDPSQKNEKEPSTSHVGNEANA